MHLIDTHTHLDFPDFDPDRTSLLARSRALGVRQMVVLGVYQDNWQRLWDEVQTDPQLYAAFGLHPVYLEQHRPEHVRELGQWLERLAGHPQLCAVGEIGLDYFCRSWIATHSRHCLKRSYRWRQTPHSRPCCTCAVAMRK